MSNEEEVTESDCSAFGSSGQMMTKTLVEMATIALKTIVFHEEGRPKVIC